VVALQVEMKEYLKERKASEKVIAIAMISTKISDGDEVTCRFKDGVVEGVVVAKRDKSLSILTPDVLNLKGQPSRLSRSYDSVIEINGMELEKYSAPSAKAEVEVEASEAVS